MQGIQTISRSRILPMLASSRDKRLIICECLISAGRFNIITVILRVSALFVLLAMGNLFLIDFEPFNHSGYLVILRFADILGLRTLERGEIGCQSKSCALNTRLEWYAHLSLRDIFFEPLGIIVGVRTGLLYPLNLKVFIDFVR